MNQASAGTVQRFDYQSEGDIVTFWLKVQPRAHQEKLMVYGTGQLRLQVTAPPAGGRANDACIQFFARHLSLARAHIGIVTGHRAIQKLFRVTGPPAREPLATAPDTDFIKKP